MPARSFAELWNDIPAEQVLARTSGECAVNDGRAFMCTTGALSVAVAGNFRAALLNPASSGKTLHILSLSVYANQAMTTTARINPTTGVPTTALTPFNLNLAHYGATNPVAELDADANTTTAIGGGAILGVIGTGPNVRDEIALHGLVVPPGVTLGINAAVTAAASAILALAWAEQDI